MVTYKSNPEGKSIVNRENMSASISKKVMKGMIDMIKESNEGLIRNLASKYGFNAEDELELLVEVKREKMERKKSTVKSVPLPYDGRIWDDCCKAIKPYHGLYSQCTNKRGDEEYCASCTKMEKNGKLVGNISEREERGDEWRDPKGRKPVNYLKVLRYLHLTREDVDAYLLREDLHISEKHFIEEEKSRGRKAKSAATSDTDSEKESKKRGRPKKSEKVVEVSTTENLFDTLISDARSPRSPSQEQLQPAAEEISDVSDSDSEKEPAEKEKKAPAEKKEKKAPAAEKKEKAPAEKKEKAPAEKEKKAPAEKKEKKAAVEKVIEEDEEEEEEAITLRKFEHSGVKYFKDSENNVYDKKSQEKIGVWNESTDKIVFVSSEELETEESDSDSSDSESDDE
jgi:hypothetical protein